MSASFSTKIFAFGGDKTTRSIWGKLTGYSRRALVEITFYRYKKMFGKKAFSRTHERQIAENQLKCLLMNKMTDEALAFIQENKVFFPTIENDNICLTHSDFKPVNLLYTDTKKVFVLDWEFVHAGISVLDFSILLRHRHGFPLDLSTLESSYIHFGGHLPAEWLRSAFITDFVNIVTLMNTPPERPKLFHQLKSAIQSTIAHWESTNDLYRLGSAFNSYEMCS